MVGSVLSGSGTNSTDDELHDNHACGTEDEKRATSNLLDHDERGGGREHVDKRGDERDQEGVVDGTKLLEENGSKVEDEVDTSQLLHGLHEDTESSTASVGRRLGDLALEAGHPGAKVAGLGNNRHLVLVVGNDLSEFILNVLGVGGLTTDTAKSVGSLVKLSLLDPESGRFGQKSKTDSEDDSPQELDGNRDTVRTGITAFLSRVDDAVGEQDTNGNAELVT